MTKIRVYITKVYQLDVEEPDEEAAMEWALSDEISPIEIEETGTFVGYSPRELAELVEDEPDEETVLRWGYNRYCSWAAAMGISPQHGFFVWKLKVQPEEMPQLIADYVKAMRDGK